MELGWGCLDLKEVCCDVCLMKGTRSMFSAMLKTSGRTPAHACHVKIPVDDFDQNLIHFALITN
jgi:hypothetical protein